MRGGLEEGGEDSTAPCRNINCNKLYTAIIGRGHIRGGRSRWGRGGGGVLIPTCTRPSSTMPTMQTQYPRTAAR